MWTVPLEVFNVFFCGSFFFKIYRLHILYVCTEIVLFDTENNPKWKESKEPNTLKGCRQLNLCDISKRSKSLNNKILNYRYCCLTDISIVCQYVRLRRRPYFVKLFCCIMHLNFYRCNFWPFCPHFFSFFCSPFHSWYNCIFYIKILFSELLNYRYCYRHFFINPRIITRILTFLLTHRFTDN